MSNVLFMPRKGAVNCITKRSPCKCKVAGWGQLKKKGAGKDSFRRRSKTIKIGDKKNCRKYYSENALWKYAICAGTHHTSALIDFTWGNVILEVLKNEMCKFFP